jgi:predicted nucleic acid-binding protein
MNIVLLDAQILIALDPHANMEDSERNAALEILDSILNDPSKKIAITPLLRYEIMCGIKDPDVFQEIDDLLNNEKVTVFPVKDAEAYCAIQIFQEARKQAVSLKSAEPKKYKFDLLHVASADVNALHFESRDKGVEKMKTLLTNLKKTNNA